MESEESNKHPAGMVNEIQFPADSSSYGMAFVLFQIAPDDKQNWFSNLFLALFVSSRSRKGNT